MSGPSSSAADASKPICRPPLPFLDPQKAEDKMTTFYVRRTGSDCILGGARTGDDSFCAPRTGGCRKNGDPHTKTVVIAAAPNSAITESSGTRFHDGFTDSGRPGGTDRPQGTGDNRKPKRPDDVST